MPRDAEALKMALWADTGERQTPEEAGFSRQSGWPVAYEQIGTEKFPERLVFNQLLRELTGLFLEMIAYGVLSWDDGTNYSHHAFALGSDGSIHRTLRDSGPDVEGGAVDPTTPNNDAWEIY